ncbi:polycomb group RING finger protein 3 [Clonorchis sinensis]|uniref:Polycomb group RING finger protein 3 n=1 Tax=Clonorchis sinensis TaxID=79923 RepID=G7YVT1_CLOSI|nr:polycomb group RING finger protein 3 [Clonorchis sinensis]
MGKSPPPSEELVRERLSPNGLDSSGDASTGQFSSPSASNLSHAPDYHRNDEQVNVHLEPGSDSLEPLTFKYLRLSSRATVTHLRKYVAQQVLHDISRFRDIDIFIQNNEDGTFLGRDHILKFVRVVYWNDVCVFEFQITYFFTG